MSRINVKFVLAYIVLVALPVLGLVGILKSGRHLAAPLSIDGTWSLQVDSAQIASLPCGKTLAAAPEKAFSISQSGRTFVLDFANGPKASASGTLEGSSLRASITPSPEWSSENGCGSGRALILLATLDPSNKPKSLVGSLVVDNCPTCSAVQFRAVQKPASPTKGGR